MTEQTDDLEELWSGLLSCDAGLVRRIWNDLTDDEAQAVAEHLQKMVTEEGFSEDQKQAAQAALEAIKETG
jgi:hypothetical protein